MPASTDIVIVGGGPVGLFLGLCLHYQGIDCVILEQREDPVPDSRSLGIHPPSMELFDQLGIAEPFMKHGLKIRRGIAHDGKQQIGEIRFEECPQPFNFILACPQSVTESILREAFREAMPNGLITGATVTDLNQKEGNVQLRYHKGGTEKLLSPDLVIGCDGKNSLVRKQAGIHYGGKRYPDTYIMGDFEDHTSFGADAAVYLPPGGLIECFPLPNGMRRWVVKTGDYISTPDDRILTELVQQRTGVDLSGLQSTMLSSFGVQHYVAEFLYQNRVVLCGDAAHLVSPIGGQGMNLGWLGAWKLSQAIARIHNDQEEFSRHLQEYQTYQKKIVKKAARRAEWNMALGRSSKIPFLKKVLVRLMLNTPLRRKAARSFTMRELDSGWL